MTRLALLALTAALAGCPSEDRNPERLWFFATEGTITFSLVDTEPEPY
jgi:hypothetical protein